MVQTDESWAISRETAKLVREADRVTGDMTIPIAISARHVHLTVEMVGKLFGEGRRLTERKELSQPGQFVCEERVNLIGPKRRIDNVAIIGPAPQNYDPVCAFLRVRFCRIGLLPAVRLPNLTLVPSQTWLFHRVLGRHPSRDRPASPTLGGWA